MGLVLDSSAPIAAERAAKPISELLRELEEQHGETEMIISTVSVVELEHELHRAQTPNRPNGAGTIWKRYTQRSRFSRL